MPRRPLRIATTTQLERSAREAGFDVYVVPRELPTDDFHRSFQQRLADGPVMREFLEGNDIDLLVDHNTETLTFCPVEGDSGRFALTTALLKIPYVASYLDPITSTMRQVPWAEHWQVLESPDWIKWIFETAHADELKRLGVPQVLTMPMAAANDDFDLSPAALDTAGPVVAFMGHPGSTWFSRNQAIPSGELFAGLTAAAVQTGMPDLPFHKIHYDLYQFEEPPRPDEDASTRAAKTFRYFNSKFTFNAFLAIKQRDRFARFLKLKLGESFELVGDFWNDVYKLPHTPRIWDMNTLHRRMRQVPICLNLMKGCLETGLNIRHFEITAYGGFMLTYATAELGSCFVIGEECDVFSTEEELLEKIAFYLEHPQRRREIAMAGQRRTLREHLYSHRLTRLVEILRQTGWLPAETAAPPEPAMALAAGRSIRPKGEPTDQVR